MGEETYKPGQKLSNKPTFIVDPIDGTTNFVHNYPYVSISLGLAVNHAPVVGVIFNPFTNWLYTGVRGNGSFMTNRNLPESDPEYKQKLPLRDPEPLGSLDTALIGIEWGSDRAGNDLKVKANTFRRLAASKEEGGAMVHSLRSLGSAALNMCGVASGHLDAYWEAGCWAWVSFCLLKPPEADQTSTGRLCGMVHLVRGRRHRC
jgi:myo-inositol-1(or 4)-monophosphatase